MRYQITHITNYDYSDPVSISHHIARVTPRDLPHQHCHSHELDISPGASVKNERTDYFGNKVCFFSMQKAHLSLAVTAKSIVEVHSRDMPDRPVNPTWSEVRSRFQEETWSEDAAVQEFVFASPLIPKSAEMAAYAAESFDDETPFIDCVLGLTCRIFKDFTYDSAATTVATPLLEVWKNRRGVCQDFAHLQIACLRSLGIPARYVSGYLETVPPPGKARLIGADASHAWLSFFCPGAGWFDVDPTNNLIPSTRHVTLAWGRDFSDVSPIRGVILGGSVQVLKVSVDVAPVD
ncbi:MAG: transglutaminase domain protein [Verrucomicrobiales bacterium]|nr:transglutaminase domain protein [Verrucomicrobiales bacterium]